MLSRFEYSVYPLLVRVVQYSLNLSSVVFVALTIFVFSPQSVVEIEVLGYFGTWFMLIVVTSETESVLDAQ